MATRLKGRDLLCLKDFSKEEVLEIISFGDKLKMDAMAGKQEHYLEGKSIAMIFQKASTRTRVSFEVAARSEPSMMFCRPDRAACTIWSAMRERGSRNFSQNQTVAS